MTPTSAAAIDVLTDINVADLLDATGLARLQGTPLQRLFRPSARRFARIAHGFDQQVGAHGLSQGSSWLMAQMTAGLRASGAEQVPAQGPVVILANHPGMTDTVALFSSLPFRPDLQVLALDRPFLRALHHVVPQLIFLPDDASGRMAALRAGARHLAAGGALLTFPAGEIEPDPAAFGPQRALASLANWSGSYRIFARLVPETRFVPVLVSHVISGAAQRHPLTRLRRGAHNREKLAVALQISLKRYRQDVARVAFGAALAPGPSLCADVVAQMQQLIQRQSAPTDTHG